MLAELGLLNQKVTIQSRTATSDGRGGRTYAWATRCAVWAEVAPVSGAEAIQARELQGVLLTKLRLHFRDDVLVKDRVVVGSRTLEIDSVLDQTGKREQLLLTCREVQT